MKITELSFQNFRTFKDTQNLTGIVKNNYLIGPNSAGKSNIFRGIELLKKVFTDQYQPNLSDYFDSDNTKNLVVSVTLELSESDKADIIQSVSKSDNEINLQGTTILKDIRYEVTFNTDKKVNEIFSIRNHLDSFETKIESLDTENYSLQYYDLITTLKPQSPTPSSAVHTISGSNSTHNAMRALNSTISKQVTSFFTNIQYVPNQRQSKNSIQPSRAEDIEPTGENLLNELGTVNDDSRSKYSDYEKSMRDATRTINSIHQPMVGTARVLQIEEHGLENRIDHSDISSGCHQMLILINIIKNMNASIILLEEPELHLHPRAQKTILDLVRKNPKTQFFIETHSPIFVGTSDSEATFLLSKNDGAGHITPILGDMLKLIKSELGIRYSDVFDHDFLCMVEGESELTAFSIFAQRLGYSVGYEFNLLNLKGCGNLKHIKALLRYLQNSDKRIFLLLDENTDAQIKTNQLIDEKLLNSKFTYKLDKSFEDQFPSALLIESMCELSNDMNFKFCLTTVELDNQRQNREVAKIFDEHLHQSNQSQIQYKTKLANKLAMNLQDDKIQQNRFAQIVQQILTECGTPRLDSLGT